MIGLKKSLVVATVMVAASAGAVVATASPAHASSGSCWSGGMVYQPYLGWEREHYCTVYHSGAVQVDRRPTGYLYAGTNWFVCQQRFLQPNPRVGNATNHWWLTTQGDVAYGNRPWGPGWGWFPATYIAQGNNEQPVPGVPECFNLH